MRSMYQMHPLPLLALMVTIITLLFLTPNRLLATENNTESNTESNTKNRKDRSQVMVIANFIDLYTGPGRGYPKFHIAEKGDVITLLKRKTQWVKVRTRQGKKGWIKNTALANTRSIDGNPIAWRRLGNNGFTQRRWELGVASGELAGASTGTVHGAWFFNSHLGLEIAVGQTIRKTSSDIALTVNAFNQPFPEWRYSPYFSIGTGIVKIDASASSTGVDDTNDILTANLGCRRYFTQNFLIRAEYNHNVFLTNRENNQELNGWKLGLSVFF